MPTSRRHVVGQFSGFKEIKRPFNIEGILDAFERFHSGTILCLLQLFLEYFLVARHDVAQVLSVALLVDDVAGNLFELGLCRFLHGHAHQFFSIAFQGCRILVGHLALFVNHSSVAGHDTLQFLESLATFCEAGVVVVENGRKTGNLGHLFAHALVGLALHIRKGLFGRGNFSYAVGRLSA